MSITAHIHSNQWTYNDRSLRLREEQRRWLEGQEFTHFVTLNYHRRYSDREARRRLRLWCKNLLSRLMRPKAYRFLKPSSVLFFVAFPEDTRNDEPHFHLLARVAREFADYFQQIAERLWENCVLSGTAKVLPIGPTEHDMKEVVSYTTKHAHRLFSVEGFVLSTEFED